MEQVIAAYTVAKPYLAAASMVSSVVQGVNAFNQGRYQSAMAELKGKQVQADSELKQLQARQKANETLRKVIATNSSVVANSAAGNVDPTSGSARKLQEVNEMYAGRDLKNLQLLQESYKTYGNVMADIMDATADQYEQQGVVGFLSGVGQAAFIGLKYAPGMMDSAVTDQGGFVPGFDAAEEQFAMMAGNESIGPNFTPIKDLGGFGGY